jgi:hypothetical protein
VNITTEVRGIPAVKAMLAQLGEDAPHAVRIGVTDIGEQAQATIQAGIGKRFTFRGTATAFKRAVVWQRPKETARRTIQGTLRVGSDSGGTKATATTNLGRILARHERTETRQAQSTTLSQLFKMGGQLIEGGFFLPAKGLRTATSNPPRALYPRNVGVAMRRDVDGRMMFASGTKKGSKRKGNGVSYFATPRGIFRRRHSGFGRGSAEAIWWFRKFVRTPARLGFWDDAQETVARVAVPAMKRAVDTVLRRTSPRGLA